MAAMQSIDFCITLIESMTDAERSKVFGHFDLIQRNAPPPKPPGSCIDGGPHDLKALRATNYLFSFLNKTKLFCRKCGLAKWE